MTPIQACDEVVIPFSPELVWRVVSDFAAYPAWWPRKIRVRVLTFEPALIGTEFEISPPGAVPCCCRVAEVTAGQRIRMKYFGGIIEGEGKWRLEPAGTGTRVSYEMNVNARGWLIAIISRFVSLAGIHSRQMQVVFANLATRTAVIAATPLTETSTANHASISR